MKNENELTEEQIADYCHANKWTSENSMIQNITIICSLARALQAERAKPEGLVWKNSPEWANRAQIMWFNDDQCKARHSENYTRELPKTIEQEIAKKYSEKYLADKCRSLEECMNDMLKEYAEAIKTT